MHIEVNGVGYHLEGCGQGEPLLLLHGFTGSAGTWRPFISRWSQRYQVIAVDLLGHGQTDAPSDASRYAVEPAVQDLCALLDALHIERAHVLGYSMGGRLALSLAVMAPERVRSLILESSSPGLAAEAERAERRRSDEALAERILAEGIEVFVDYWENLPLFHTIRKQPPETQQAIREQRLRSRPLGLAGSLRGMGTGAQPSWWDKLGDLRMPVQLIVGEEDKKFTAIARRMQERIRDCRVAIVSGAGHVVHVERADFFDTIVLEFLSKIE